MSAQTLPWRQFICRACGLIYDEEAGDADSGLAPGTRFEDIPEGWVCPLCGVVKSDFEPYIHLESTASGGVAPKVSRDAGVVIVGGGQAGWAVAEALRAIDAETPITLVSACSGDRYHKPELSIAMSRGATRDALVRESAVDAARRLGVRLLCNTFAIGLSPALRRLRTTRGTLDYTQLVLAQGSRPALPAALPPSLCWRVNDLHGWNGLHERLVGTHKHVVIVGAGMVGCELAEDFVHAGHQVTLLDIEAHPLAALLPGIAAGRLQANLESLGVRFLGDTRVVDVSALADRRKRIVTACGLRLEADEIVAATGLATESRIARAAGLHFDRGIAVDPLTLRTSAENVFALGDCISIDGAPCRFIEPIARQANVIAHAVAGRPHPDYAHGAPVIRLKTRSLPVVMHGCPCHGLEWQVVEDDAHFLSLRQCRDSNVVATLEVGSRRARLAA